MRKTFIVFTVLVLVVLLGSMAFAKHHTAEERGRALFEDPTFADGKIACSACHINGAMLQNVNSKKKFRVAGKTQDSLEEAVNACIVAANKGKPIPVNSSEMKDIVTYIRTFGK